MLKKIGLDSRSSWLLVGLNFFVILLLWFFTWWRWRLSPDFVPLHYTLYFGFDRFGPRSDLFLFPTLGTVLSGLNLAVATLVFKNSRLWHGWWLALNLLFVGVLLLALILVVLRRLA